MCKSGEIERDENQLNIISILDDIRENIEISEDDWVSNIRRMKDPYPVYKEKKEQHKKTLLKLKEERDKGINFFSIFSKEKDKDKKEKILQTKTKEIIALEVDQSPFKNSENLKGMYLFGEPGCGKTLMMDLFYKNTDVKSKKRVHFNEFMLNIHKMNHAFYIKNIYDPTFKTASMLSTDYRLLCLDEFQVHDIGDGVIMRRLFDIFWAHRIVLVATSNRVPNDLYKNGIQRELFEPFLDELEIHCQIINLEAKQDYRRMHYLKEKNIIQMRALEMDSICYFWPLGKKNKEKLDYIFLNLSGSSDLEKIEIDAFNGRFIEIMGNGKVARFDYKSIFLANFGASDFGAICTHFEAILVDNVPHILMSIDSVAKRFILFIDECYNHKVKLYMSSKTSIEELFIMDGGDGSEEMFMIHRCISRMNEMQTTKYLNEKHRVDTADI